MVHVFPEGASGLELQHHGQHQKELSGWWSGTLVSLLPFSLEKYKWRAGKAVQLYNDKGDWGGVHKPADGKLIEHMFRAHVTTCENQV